jgi:hypothetical protein
VLGGLVGKRVGDLKWYYIGGRAGQWKGGKHTKLVGGCSEEWLIDLVLWASALSNVACVCVGGKGVGAWFSSLFQAKHRSF